MDMTEFEDRKSYDRGNLEDFDHADIIGLLRRWLQEAKASDPSDYNAMTLSTVGRDGHPNARIVLLRSLEQTEGGWSVAFYTNYQSAKGQELLAHPHAAATFFWKAHSSASSASEGAWSSDVCRTDSDRYFASRPRESQIGAWASAQSRASPRTARRLQAAWDEQNNAAFGRAVPRPATLGRVSSCHIGHEVELWQGRPGRMHDRISAELTTMERGPSARLQP